MLKMAIHCILLLDNQASQLHQEMQKMKVCEIFNCIVWMFYLTILKMIEALVDFF